MLLCFAPCYSAAAQEEAGGPADPGRVYKRAAIVTGALTLAFAGVGTALVVTQPDESFTKGIGAGHLLWSPALAVQTVTDIIAMKGARRSSRSIFRRQPATLLWHRLSVGVSAAITAGGLGLLAFGLADDAPLDAGVGAVFATYGAALLTFALVDLVQTKRRLEKCAETCPPRPVTGLFAIRF